MGCTLSTDQDIVVPQHLGFLPRDSPGGLPSHTRRIPPLSPHRSMCIGLNEQHVVACLGMPEGKLPGQSTSQDSYSSLDLFDMRRGKGHDRQPSRRRSLWLHDIAQTSRPRL